MKCGKCKTEGQTIEHVRACYGQPARTSVGAGVPALNVPPPPTPNTRGRRCRECHLEAQWHCPQCSACVDLGEAKCQNCGQLLAVAFRNDVNAASDAYWDGQVQASERAEDERVAAFKAQRDDVLSGASAIRQRAVAARRGEVVEPKRPTTTALVKYQEIVDGYYATPSRTGNNDLDFWRINGGKGKWEGYKFAKRVIGGHPDQGVNKAETINALEAILEYGVINAAKKYGEELGSCYRCNRHLTDATSRALGIGPECRSK